MSNRKIKTMFSVDKLKLCYRQQSGATFGYLADCLNLNAKISEINSTIDRDDYTLHLIDHSSNEEEVTAITISACFEMDGERHRLGVFDIKKGSQYCFFCFENKALYTPLSMWMGGNITALISSHI